MAISTLHLNIGNYFNAYHVIPTVMTTVVIHGSTGTHYALPLKTLRIVRGGIDAPFCSI